MDIDNYYNCCELCPNMCKVDRNNGQLGRCGQDSQIRIAWAGLHKGEEPPVSGENGSGMIFFCGCPLHCQYCQNYQISQEGWDGLIISVEELANLMLKLQSFGAETINLVTGTHYIPSIISAIQKAKASGLTLPIVWNSSGYENVAALRLIDPYIDIYLIDVKTLDSKVASSFCGLEKYTKVIGPVMMFLKKRYQAERSRYFDYSYSPVLVRHLVFPGCIDATKDFLQWFSDNFKSCFMLSFMIQFVAPKEDPGFEKMTEKQYVELLDYISNHEIDGYIQEPSDKEYLWIPDFRRSQPFPEGFATPLPWFLNLKKKKLKSRSMQ